jgi:hypothetical protein
LLFSFRFDSNFGFISGLHFDLNRSGLINCKICVLLIIIILIGIYGISGLLIRCIVLINKVIFLGGNTLFHTCIVFSDSSVTCDWSLLFFLIYLIHLLKHLILFILLSANSPTSHITLSPQHSHLNLLLLLLLFLFLLLHMNLTCPAL